MSERTLEILQELAGLYDQQRRFVTPKPSDEPVVFSAREIATLRTSPLVWSGSVKEYL
jgi:hypothetical protein